MCLPISFVFIDYSIARGSSRDSIHFRGFLLLLLLNFIQA
jgi:hypothetical protein